ncbi:hypothetical protein F5146DRAFT_995072 [Armillaria mellea]|nr:hypothetical protein F5146DRAFT_995072 [Armillaria mellea]
MSNEPQPVSLAQLLRSSQTARHRPAINPERLLATATPPAPAPAHNSDLIANHGNVVNLSPNHLALSPLMRMTGTGIYPALPMHTTGNPTTMLPQLYVRPGPVVTGLLSHAFNPNAFLGDPPASSAPAFVGANTTGCKKASILRMTLGKGQAPVCHILIYLCLHYNTDLTKPKIPGLKSNNLDSLMFKNMGWCFFQLATHKPYYALLTYNKKHTEDQSNLSYMIQYASLESKFNRRRKKKPLSMPGQFTIIIAPTTAPICHNLHNCNLEYLMLHEMGFMPVLQNGPCTTSYSSCEAMVVGAMKTNYLVYMHAKASALTNLEETFQSITVSQIVLIGAVPMLQHSGQGCRLVQSAVMQTSIPVPQWQDPNVQRLCGAYHLSGQSNWMSSLSWLHTMLVLSGQTVCLDTMALTGPSIEALADAILTLCLFVAKNGWDAPNKRFHEFIDNWQGPEFSTPDITCDNWHLPATLGQMKVIIEPSGSHRAGINKIVFREALLKVMRDTDLYSALPNNSPYFTAKFPMAGTTTSQRIQWRVQGLLLAICTVTFRMPPLPVSPFLFLALVLETPQIPCMLDALTGPALEVGLQAPDPEKAILQNRVASPTIQDDPNNLLEYLESNYDRNIHSIDALMEVIQIETSAVGTDAFCSRRCDWGFSKDENGWDLPLYISAKKAFQIQFLPPDYHHPSSQSFSTSTCFTVAKVKLDDDLCTLLSGCSTEVFPDFAACLDLWLSDNLNIITTI